MPNARWNKPDVSPAVARILRAGAFVTVEVGATTLDLTNVVRATCEPSLEALQAAVRGYIECVTGVAFGVPCDLIVNEEGKLNGFRPNDLATEFYHAGGAFRSDVLVGPCVILTGKARLK